MASARRLKPPYRRILTAMVLLATAVARDPVDDRDLGGEVDPGRGCARVKILYFGPWFNR
jgi:hypothetical protein